MVRDARPVLRRPPCASCSTSRCCLREFFALDAFSPGWTSVRLLAWMAAAAAAVAATLMWLNLRGFRDALDEAAARRLTSGAVATTASAVVLLGIAVAHYSFGRRGSRVGATLLAIAVIRVAGASARRARHGGRAAGAHAPGPETQSVTPRDPPGPRVIDAAARRRVARIRAAARRRRTPAAFARLLDKGARDGPRHDPPDPAGSGLGGRRDRDVPVEERCPVGRVVLRPAGRLAPSICCPITAFSRASCSSASFATSRIRRPLAGTAALDDPRRQASASASSRWPLTYPAEARERFYRQRSVSPARRVDCGVRPRRFSA